MTNPTKVFELKNADGSLFVRWELKLTEHDVWILAPINAESPYSEYIRNFLKEPQYFDGFTYSGFMECQGGRAVAVYLKKDIFEEVARLHVSL